MIGGIVVSIREITNLSEDGVSDISFDRGLNTLEHGHRILKSTLIGAIGPSGFYLRICKNMSLL